MAYQGIQGDINAVMTEVDSSGLLVSLATISKPDGLFGPSGAPSGNYVNVPGLMCIPCIDAFSQGDIQATEVKELQEVQSRGLRHLLLNGYYPEATPDGQIPSYWRATVDGITYDILGVEHDSQTQMTRLKLQLILT
jgi:hypothetical protein